MRLSLHAVSPAFLVSVCLAATPVALGAGGEPEPSAPAAAAPAETKTDAPAAAGVVAEAQALADGGKHSDAEKLLAAAIKKGEKSPEAFNLLGFSQRKQGKFKPAIASYEKALKAKPDYPQAKEYLAVAYLNAKQPKKAKALHDELAKSHPDLAKMIADEAARLKVKW